MPLLSFKIYAILSAVFLITGTILELVKRNSYRLKLIGDIFLYAGIFVQLIFITLLWITLKRPPLSTLGETRIWYTFFLSAVGLLTIKRHKHLLIFIFIMFMSLLFLSLNYFIPENYDKTLKPALQSPWFGPHVIVYILGYAFLAGSAIAAVIGLIKHYMKINDEKLLLISDNLVILGYSCVTLGLVFGALWAKEAWGHYWTWDPKETWAFITWAGYLVYMHVRFFRPQKKLAALWTLSFAFIILLIAWMGINYLPSAQNSVHIYSNYQ